MGIEHCQKDSQSHCLTGGYNPPSQLQGECAGSGDWSRIPRLIVRVNLMIQAFKGLKGPSCLSVLKACLYVPCCHACIVLIGVMQ